MKQTVIEKNISKILSNDYVLEVQSGTSALIISLLLQKNKSKKNEVLLPSICCPAVLTAINFCNLKPVFVDMEKKFFNMDLNSIEKLLNKDTLAIIGVHSYGIAFDTKKIRSLCNENEIFFIEDCCLSIGGKDADTIIGTSGDISIFSFGSGKIISLKGGAMAFKDRSDFMNASKLISSNNILKCPSYDDVEMNQKFKSLEENIENRRIVAKYYYEQINNPKFLKPVYRHTDVYWRYPLLINGNREKFISIAKENNLIITHHYPSLANFQYDNKLNVADEFNESIINLFVNININDPYADKVCNFISEYE
tara:strand:- start:3047 stop:3976 length:930 start_codon:yes stop_codon:yes gene_type:complete